MFTVIYQLRQKKLWTLISNWFNFELSDLSIRKKVCYFEIPQNRSVPSLKGNQLNFEEWENDYILKK